MRESASRKARTLANRFKNSNHPSLKLILKGEKGLKSSDCISMYKEGNSAFIYKNAALKSDNIALYFPKKSKKCILV